MSSIRNRILVVLLQVGFLPLLLVFAVSKTVTSHDLERSERDKIAAVSNEIARQIGTIMDRAASDLESLRSNPLVIDPNSTIDQRMDEMRRLVKAYTGFSDITIYDPNGIMIETTTQGRHPEPVDNSAWFEIARDHGTIQISNPHKVLGHPGLHLKVYIPLHITGQPRPSVLKARLTFDPVWNLIDGAEIGKEGEMIIVDSHGKILASRDKNLILERFDLRFPPDFWTRTPRGNYTTESGTQYAFDARPLGEHVTRVGETWALLSLLPHEELTAAYTKSERLQLFAAALSLIIASGLGLTLSHRLAAPVVLASKAARKVARGDLDTRVPESGPLEMRQLAGSFNQMIEEVRGARDHLESLVQSRTKKLRESQEALEELASQLQAAYDSTPEGILVVKPDGTIITANRRIQEFFAPGETGSLASLPFKLFQVKLQGCFAKPDPLRWKFFERNPDGIGSSEWEITSGRPRSLSVYTAPVKNQRGAEIARLWMFNDITEKRYLEQSLQQAQKMEAIGRLAGGVAHDFNNLLTGIIGNLALAQMESDRNGNGDSDSSRRFISSAKKAGERASDLVKQLLGFSRRSHLQLKRCDVNDIASEIKELLQHTIDPRIEIAVNLSDTLWDIEADPTQIQQVLMNMCVNAADAMPETGGHISITTKNVTVKAGQAATFHCEPGEYTCIAIRDDGSGMSDEIQQKMFEPFFTTKDPGKGTGLGLATSYGIVHQHGGSLTCESIEGHGTTFTIYLPRIKSEKAADVPAEIARPAAQGNNATVLLVDDEEMIRTVATSALEHHGFSVLTAEDGLKAIEICEAKRDEIDLMILDLTMPKLSGRDTFRRIQELENPPPILLCSGYLVDLDSFEEELGARPAGFVQKPFDISALANAVQDAIQESPRIAASK